MANQSQMKAAIVLLLMQSTLTNTAKNIARPVHEVINEQARIDDKKPFLPYSNPLAVTSNAQLHAQHQQAMFNAERVRQHRAQIQRLNKIAKPVDSYMKAYQESQENHQLALEQMQSNLNKRSRRPELKSLQAKETKNIQVNEAVKINRGDATAERNRNHRSFGSVLYIPQNKGKIRVLPGPTYDQGVTIKPNGNIGLNKLQDDEKFLYTAAVPSKTEYIYPKYTDTLNYNSLQDIQSLNYLLGKPAQEQLNGFNNLVHTNEPDKNILEKPIDLYFYLKDSPVKTQYSQQYPQPYAAKYLPEYNKEKPITEEIDDVEDPNKVKKVVPYGIQPVVTPMNIETATVKSNYYTIEHVVKENTPKIPGYSPQYSVFNENYKPIIPEQNVHYTVQEDPKVQYGFVQEKPKYEEFIQPKPTPQFRPLKAEVTEYIKHQPQGVQHLNEDGTGTSAYGDDEVQYAANYEFGYRVKDHETGSDFGHEEHKSGEKTKGSYHVLLPDGRMQMVRYSAGPSGYHADISYDHLQ